MKEVALRKESVDRNSKINTRGSIKMEVALRKESVDRNTNLHSINCMTHTSLSARRAWIEIANFCRNRFCPTSLSARRAWIEIPHAAYAGNTLLASLSARRAWIEILLLGRRC